MSDAPKIGPLLFVREGNCLRFTLVPSEEIVMELPPDYEAYLATRIDEVFARDEQLRIMLDLQQAPALSSRQLGALLALHKALRRRVPRVPVTGVKEGVRRLLETTRTAQFFEVV